jgi:hypothetical protein
MQSSEAVVQLVRWPKLKPQSHFRKGGQYQVLIQLSPTRTFFKIMLFFVIALVFGVSSASRVLLPLDLKDTEFESVIFSSSPLASFDVISVVWYTPSPAGSECSSSTFSIEANGTQAVLIETSGTYCFQELLP